ncbi:hypothetical protein F1906_12170 [Akkermansia muciniphila]|nr:hypothetical protein F1906_12170 [Akkermansia muciniphila]
MNISEKERLRAAAQLSLEHGIPASERNKKGQFATPYKLALQIVKEAFRLCPKAQNVLEPSCGTGAFISAVRSLSDTTMVKACELDSRFFKPQHLYGAIFIPKYSKKIFLISNPMKNLIF